MNPTHENNVKQAINALHGRQFVGVLHIQRACGLSYAAARIVIDDLVDRKLLRRVYGAEGPYVVCKTALAAVEGGKA